MNKLEITEKEKSKDSKNELNKLNESIIKEKNELNLNSREIQKGIRRTIIYKSPFEMNMLKNNLIGYKEKEKIINKSEKKDVFFFLI